MKSEQPLINGRKNTFIRHSLWLKGFGHVLFGGIDSWQFSCTVAGRLWNPYEAMTMLRYTQKQSLRLAYALVVACLALSAAGYSSHAQAAFPRTNAAVVAPVPKSSPSALDTKRLFALGMIETGNNDREVGGAGEISRYQIHPVVWKSYSKSMDYWNPDVALEVARQHWTCLAAYYKEKTGHEPDDYDMYVLWNTKYGYYAHKQFSHTLISPVVQDRAQRFVNLVNRKNY
jgi:hypothetical protein